MCFDSPNLWSSNVLKSLCRRKFLEIVRRRALRTYLALAATKEVVLQATIKFFPNKAYFFKNPGAMFWWFYVWMQSNLVERKVQAPWTTLLEWDPNRMQKENMTRFEIIENQFRVCHLSF